MQDFNGDGKPIHSLGTDVPTLVALLVCLIPTTIGALLAAIGIAGMDRALRANIIAKSGKAVEVAGDVDTLLLGQDGHDHHRQPPRHAVRALRRHERRGVGPACRARLGGRRNARRQEHRRSVLTSRTAPAARQNIAHGDPRQGAFHPLYGPDPHERHRPARRPRDPQGRPRTRSCATSAAATARCPPTSSRASPAWPARAPRRCWSARATAWSGMVVLEDILKPGIAERFERLRRMGLRT